MLHAAVYACLRLLIGLIVVRCGSEQQHELELLALRHQLAILRRQVKRPELTKGDRLILAALGRHLPEGSLLFAPATLLRWHRELVRRRWAAFGQRARRGRPPIPADLQELIVRLARENPRWGARRIQGELLKLGYRVSATTVRTLLGRHRVPPAPRREGPTWSQFLRAQAHGVLACDFFAVETVLLRTLYVLVAMELGSRRVLLSACTANPDSAWVVQQARNLAHDLQDRDAPAAFLVRDRDSKYTDRFDAVFRAEGVSVLRTPYRSPRANAHLERLVKTTRRECLDWLLIVNERHLRQVLAEFFDHYNRSRPHLALGLCPPCPEDVPAQGAILRRRRLHGLINEYSRAA